MTFVGVRIENGEFEVGFRAATRRDYEEHLRLVAAAADLHWPPGAAEPDLSRDPAEPPQEGDFAPAPASDDSMETRVRKRDERKRWLERQGLA